MASDVAGPLASKDGVGTITVVVRRLPEGVWLATSDDLPGLIVETETREEAIDLSRELAWELLGRRESLARFARRRATPPAKAPPEGPLQCVSSSAKGVSDSSYEPLEQQDAGSVLSRRGRSRLSQV
jgi:hypothetical protein